MRNFAVVAFGIVVLASTGSAFGNEDGARFAAPTSFPAEWGIPSPRRSATPRATPTPRTTPTSSSANSENERLGIVLVVVLGGGSLAILFAWSVMGDRARRRRFLEADARYKTALEFLRLNPSHEDARLRCIEAGRAFYLITSPNTITVHSGGGMSGHQDNSAGREARIQADIEARIGHLKTPRIGGDAVDAQPATGNPFCAACGTQRGGEARFCGKCGAPFPVPS